jgi:hypothetical protein
MAADLISLPTSPRGFVGCLVLVDHYSKWVTAVPIKNKSGETILKAFHDQIFPSLIRIPTNILTENGPEFTCTKFSEFLMQSNVNHKLTTPYCPSSNGAIERVNRTIKNFLRSLVSDGVPWDVALPKALIVYNHTLHSIPIILIVTHLSKGLWLNTGNMVIPNLLNLVWDSWCL